MSSSMYAVINTVKFVIIYAVFISQGIVPALRKEVWKYLLGFYPWNSTAKEREDIVRKKT